MLEPYLTAVIVAFALLAIGAIGERVVEWWQGR